ncbi:MAG: arsenate reductase family protein [Clostridia bacterium]|nr:arsenate reductase family protein [Clostridia bacterium]
MIFLCYAKCTTCQKAKKWLEENQIRFEERPIKEQNPTREELRAWQQKSGLPLRKFFNTSGIMYREMELTKKLPNMTEEEMLDLLASDGMLVKRPLLIGDDRVLVGFQAAAWQQALL